MSDRLTQILLIDDDPIFRLGLSTALEAFSDLQVIAEVDTGAAAMERLAALQRQASVNLVVLELTLGRSHSHLLSGLSLCQQIKADYPDLPILLLTAESEPTQLSAARELGVEGYCPKGCAIGIIVEVIRQLREGESYWQMLPALSTVPVPAVRPPSWHHQLRLSGLQQIEDALAMVTSQLQQPKLSNLDWLFWSGRRRELLAARWLVNQLLPTDVIIVEKKGGTQVQDRRSTGEQLTSFNHSSPRPLPGEPAQNSSFSLSLQPSTPQDVTLAKLQSGLPNLTDVSLEIDILQVEKRRDLLYIVVQNFEEMLEALRFAQVTIEQLPQKRSRLLQDLWQVSLTKFFGKYYTLALGKSEVEIVNVLLSDAIFVQTEILDKIPLVVELLAHRLFEAPLTIDNVAYPARTPEALARSELLLQNLMIQVGNGVIQTLLNRLADVETIKQSFYDSRFISSREIARFRNNLSWKYRRVQLLDEPKAIFESRYDLFVLSDIGIKKTSIYAPRRQELEQLRGIPLAVTIAYEFRDAIAPRLRGTVAWVGKGVVYVLTQVLGRGIGLILRGVIQGVGSALQETRFSKNGERGK
ncbi:MAG TPA: DUF3685 domain-containing protein [Cyanobacteria bacterium UBA8803]|nr:DUF3685 domain-containing protein [Cyanobacteria bacterium UBA9273]HBL60870.1 DUF3685 domain-containing protein [Cyanobacteria bacterium UBA8803]